jgi:hypothetical protein
MKKTALITGATSGIGKALAYEHAKQGGNLVLLARREKLLQQIRDDLRDLYDVNVAIYPCDLTDLDALKTTVESIQRKGIRIDYLMNNAGTGGYGLFKDTDWTHSLNILRLNCSALTYLIHAFLPQMLERDEGRILNVASTAAWMPGPLQSVYFGSKAYVRSISWALIEELRDTKVTVTIGCPGPTLTGFIEASKMEGSRLFKKGKRPEIVAKAFYKALLAGKHEVITDCAQSIQLKYLMPFSPMCLVLKLTKWYQQKVA